ncbi:ABC transporter substrate-binding protein, partial [Candidatus Kaiserbacteria bacterium]|nr:ABC transporter substrate-binding protein [Candidatus Kaiserbacteria bacterium]
MKISIKPSRRLLDRFLSLIESVPGSDKLILRLAFFAVVSSVIWLLFTINQQYSEQTAVRGGSITEGIIGTPRFVNPALAITRADQDVTALVYSGLMKIDSEGNLVNDLAESITTSDDGLTYNIVLRQDVSFHDGTPLTAKDVIFTIQLIQNPDLKSPLRGNWSDVTLEEVGEYELNIVLKEPYAPFIENFTLGIMPAHSWSSLPVEQLPFSQLNTEPIGSGSFAITKTEHNTSGLIKNYTLTAYRKNNSNPKIDTLELDFYQNEDDLITAVQNKMVDATAYISAERVSELDIKNFQLINEPLPRTFGIFFNQNRS